MIRNRRYTSLILLFAMIMVMGLPPSAWPLVKDRQCSSGTFRSNPAFGNWYVIGWTAVNFLILLALLYKFAYGPINAMLEERSATIEGPSNMLRRLKPK